jgi:hypothetical protein
MVRPTVATVSRMGDFRQPLQRHNIISDLLTSWMGPKHRHKEYNADDARRSSQLNRRWPSSGRSGVAPHRIASVTLKVRWLSARSRSPAGSTMTPHGEEQSCQAKKKASPGRVTNRREVPAVKGAILFSLSRVTQSDKGRERGDEEQNSKTRESKNFF